tara:strand:+ start:372 stop:632 length:261 start_codon:yes stop_codon:yes gene_type:complete
MAKVIKIVHLTTNQILISQIEEVAAIDIGEPDCKLLNPFLVKENEVLEPWLLKLTKDDIFMISSDKILTLADPTPTLLEKYLDLTE